MSLFNDDIKRKDPFKAPDGYFDSLADRIDARLDRPAKDTKIHILRRPVRLVYAAAAVITLLAVCWTLLRENTQPSSARLVAELTDQEIIDYLADSEMSVEEILENVSFEVLDTDSLQWQVMPEVDLAPGDIDELIELYDLEEMENS